MKKRLLSLLLIALLLVLLLPAAFAADNVASESAEDFPYVLDKAGLLRDSVREALEETARSYSEAHHCKLYIVTVQDHTEFDYDVYEAAKGIFLHYDLGCGETREGILLLLSMAERDYALIGHGVQGEAVCGYESSWIIEDAFLDNFRNDDWRGGFADYLDACDRQLTKLEDGEDITEGADIIVGDDGLEYHSYNQPGAQEKNWLVRGLTTIFAPLIAAFGTCATFKAQMRPPKEARHADAYLVPRSMDLRVKQDLFINRTETRTLIESDSGSRGSSGGGGSSFHSGGGFSGRSGKF